MFTQPPQIPRSPFASTLTVAFHVGLGLVILAVSAVPNVPDIVDQRPLTYIAAAPVPDLRFEIPPPPPPAPPAPKPVPRLEIPKPEPPKAIERPVIEKPPVPTPEPERRAVEPPREEPRPVPQPPKVVVGAFSDATAARTTERKVVEDVNFASSATRAARANRELEDVEGFDADVPSSQRRDRPGLVENAGFGTAASGTQVRRAPQVAVADFATAATSPRSVQGPRGVTPGGFGDGPPAPAARTAPKPTTSPGGFEQAPAPKAATPPPAKPLQADKPVEVLYKPTPAYTDAARAERVEGEVALEVEFTAAGQVRVLRVVRGLGYGLDEMARRAAEQIRFRPATSRGTPVDVRATLTIVFRLT